MGARDYGEALQRYAEARSLLARAGAVQWEGVLAWTMACIAMATGQPELAATTLRDTVTHLDAEPVHGISRSPSREASLAQRPSPRHPDRRTIPEALDR
jgi:hypothetical protein